MKQKVILDIDPGVDDATLLAIAASDNTINTALIAVADGNVSQEASIKNTLFVLDLVKKDISVVAGAKLKKRIDEVGVAAQIRAEKMHGIESIGGVKLPPKIHHKLEKGDVADKMFEVISKHPHKMSILGCAPMTDIDYLFKKHPEAIKLVKQIIIIGGSFGLPGQPNYISYNAGTNPEAYDNVLKSGASCIIIPSAVGRSAARFSAAQVKEISKMGNFGAFLAKTFETFWEPDYAEKFVTNNDVCSYLYIKKRNMFKTKRYDVKVDTIDQPGKLTRTPNKKSKVQIVIRLKRKKFLKVMYKIIRSMRDFDWKES